MNLKNVFTTAQINWFITMLNDEIEITKGTIENENLWALGAETADQRLMHLTNIVELEDYIYRLIDIKSSFEEKE